MANYKLIDIDMLNDLIIELSELNNKELKYIIEDLQNLISQSIRGGY